MLGLDLSFLSSAQFQQAVSNIAVAVITGLAAAVSRAVYQWFNAHTSANQFAMLQEVATAAVQASEQGKIGGFVSDKKSAALQYANATLADAGLKVSAEQLATAIEAAVLREFNPNGETKPEDTGSGLPTVNSD